MAKKVILTDDNKIQVMPITRGELVLDQHGNQALHSNDFIATSDKAGLMSSVDKSKLDAFANSSEYITQQTLDTTVSGLNTTLSNINNTLNDIDTRIDGIVAGGNTQLENYATKAELKPITDQLSTINDNINEINDKIENFDFDADLEGLVKETTFNTTVSELRDGISNISTEVSKKYEKLDTGIPKEDLSNDIQEKLNSVTAMQFITHPINDQETEDLKKESLAIEIETNTYHKINNKLTNLTISFKNDQNVSLYHCFIEFLTGDNGCTLKSPTTLKWFNGKEPALIENTRYQISIVNNLGVWANYG